MVDAGDWLQVVNALAGGRVCDIQHIRRSLP